MFGQDFVVPQWFDARFVFTRSIIRFLVVRYLYTHITHNFVKISENLKTIKNLEVFKISKKSILKFYRFEIRITPSTQSNLFPMLICFFLLPKEIPFRKPI